MDEKFPPTDLDLDVLVKRVRKLVKAYPLIQRITLHELDGELPRYLISVEVENLVIGKPEGVCRDGYKVWLWVQSPARIAISRGVCRIPGKRECCNPGSAFFSSSPT